MPGNRLENDTKRITTDSHALSVLNKGSIRN